MAYDCATPLLPAAHRRLGVKSSRPAERIRELELRLSEANARIAALEAACRLAEVEPEPVLPSWTTALSGSELGAMMALYRAYPAALSNYALDEVVPRYDRVEDRDVRGMSVLIHKLRKKIGSDAIVNLWGRGYTLSPEFHARLKAELDAVDAR